MPFNVVFDYFFGFGIIQICRNLRNTESKIRTHRGSVVGVDFENYVDFFFAFADGRVDVGSVA